MKENDDLVRRMICCGALVLLGWWLRGSLGAKAAPQAGGNDAAQDGGVTPPTARFAFDAASVASAPPAAFVGPPTLPKPYANHTAAASMLGQDPTLASQASAADLSKGSVLDAHG